MSGSDLPEGDRGEEDILTAVAAFGIAPAVGTAAEDLDLMLTVWTQTCDPQLAGIDPFQLLLLRRYLSVSGWIRRPDIYSCHCSPPPGRYLPVHRGPVSDPAPKGQGA